MKKSTGILSCCLVGAICLNVYLYNEMFSLSTQNVNLLGQVDTLMQSVDQVKTDIAHQTESYNTVKNQLSILNKELNSINKKNNDLITLSNKTDTPSELGGWVTDADGNLVRSSAIKETSSSSTPAPVTPPKQPAKPSTPSSSKPSPSKPSGGGSGDRVAAAPGGQYGITEDDMYKGGEGGPDGNLGFS